LILEFEGRSRLLVWVQPIEPGAHFSDALLEGRERHLCRRSEGRLNYAYAVLQAQLQIQAVSQGYHPTIGIMHFQRPSSQAFISDLMEPERPKIDQSVIELLKAGVLHAADFTIRRDGVVRLDPQLARRVAGLVNTRSVARTLSLDA